LKMKNVEKIREGLYVKTDLFGTRVIHPYRNDDGSFNWFNLLTGGSWWNLAKILIIVAFIMISVWSYKHDVNQCWECVRNPCEYCSSCQYVSGVNTPFSDLNLSSFDMESPQEIRGSG